MVCGRPDRHPRLSGSPYNVRASSFSASIDRFASRFLLVYTRQRIGVRLATSVSSVHGYVTHPCHWEALVGEQQLSLKAKLADSKRWLVRSSTSGS